MSGSDIMVVAAMSGGVPAASSAELLGLAHRIASASGGKVTALIVGAGAAAAPPLIARGADRVLYADDPVLADYDSERWTAVATSAASVAAPRLILASHDSSGADLVPRLAFRLGGAVATGCVAVALDGAKARVTRPCHGGNAHEVVAIEASPAAVTVRSGSADALAADARRSGEVLALDPVPQAMRASVVARHRDSGEQVRLEVARVVIAGGRGLNGPEGFEPLKDLAAALGGAVGASRVPCDLGWCPHSMQIGLTGKTVNPDLYVAVGISGAGHHLAGCAGARSIVAINTDAEAPIFKAAQFGLVGDFRALVPALTRAVTGTNAPSSA
jgi:electron transfer flavoprotein alpha subunit